MKLVYIVFLISACSLNAMEKAYQIVNQTGHNVRIKFRRTDVDRNQLTSDDILVDQPLLEPNTAITLPPVTKDWIQNNIPLGLRVDHAGTSINPQSAEEQTPLIGGFHFQFSQPTLLAYRLIIIHYNNTGTISVRLESDNP